MRRTLDHVSRLLLPTGDTPSAPNWPLVRALVGQQPPSWADAVQAATLVDPEDTGGEIRWLGEGLNDSQKEAIDFCLRAEQIACIHGPPGVRVVFVVFLSCWRA